jgi:SNF2 family DNA or RNA helicase
MTKIVSAQASALETSRALDGDLVVEGLGGELRPYQRVAVKWVATYPCTLIGDDMGLGKTVAAIAAAKYLDAFPLVVVCPASVVENWKREMTKWVPSLRRVEILRGRKSYGIDPRVGAVVITYNVLDCWATNLVRYKPKGLVLDESQRIKNQRARCTKAAVRLSRAPSLDMRLGLSGTPITKTPADLMSQLRCIGRLVELGGSRGYIERWCVVDDFGVRAGCKDPEGLNATLRSGGFMMRRTKDEALDLPPKRRRKVPIELPPAARRAYDEKYSEVKAFLRQARIEKARAKREGREPDGKATAAGLRAFGELRGALADVKTEAVAGWCRAEVAKGSKLLVFAFHRRVVEAVAESLGCEQIHGGVKSDERQAIVDRFQQDDRVRALALNLGAGSVGLNLTAANVVVFAEQSLIAAERSQAEGRAHRSGQTQEVWCHHLLAVRTLDDKIYDMLAVEDRMLTETTDGNARADRSVRSKLLRELSK